MNALVIEDETVASNQLCRMIGEVAPDITVTQVLQSIEESVSWFQQNEQPDLVFMDIHLADGSAFHIFDSVSIECPIIFTTAYDQYALDAFKVNGIDYLLKPINRDDLRLAIEKYRRLRAHATDDAQHATQGPSNAELAEMLRALTSHRYKSYFLIPNADRLVPLEVSQMACIYLDNKISYAIMFDGSHHAINTPLDDIMQQLDPAYFFRANRQYIIAHNAIKDIHYWLGGKLSVKLSVETPERITISRQRASEFKEWYTA